VKRHSILGGIVSGAIAGGVATYVMDLVTTGIQNGQSPEDAELEKAGQVNGRSSVENLLELIETSSGTHIEDSLRPMALQALHYGLGIGPGALYGVLRGRVPLIGAGRGLLFGILVWAVNDEYLNTALGLAGPPDAYPPSTHLRGLVGHLALGASIDTVLDVV
jgi:uncharacterized membrane protein YagU involved in acid resistance